MKLRSFEKQVVIDLLLIGVCIAASRLTYGGVMAFLLVLVVVYSMQNKIGNMITLYMLFPMFNIVNRVVIGNAGFVVVLSRILLYALALIGMSRIQIRSRLRLPAEVLFGYLVVVCISSATGWFPLISYLKILNFSAMLLSMMYIGKVIQKDDDSLMKSRAMIMACALFMIVGSAVSYLVPSVGYSMNIRIAESFGLYLTGDDIIASEGGRLFNGMTFHSQALGAIAAVFTSWVLADMLFVECRITLLHGVSLLISPFLLFATRSRTAFVTVLGVVVVLATVALRCSKLDGFARRRFWSWFTILFVAVLALGAYYESTDHTISKWLRKTDDVIGDQRDFRTALTSSRDDAIARNLADFHRNPLFGMGFQVIAEHRRAYDAGMISLMSAPIEKGILPLMVLGEGGIIGSLVFWLFILSFYVYCGRNKLPVTMCMMTAFLASNVAEAFFFSPTSTGGLVWAVVVIGGFSSDIIAHRRSLSFGHGNLPLGYNYGLP